MADPRGSTGPEREESSPDATASGEGSRAGSAWEELRQAVGADDVAGDDDVEGGDQADPALIAEAERIADEALAEARAKEAMEAHDDSAEQAVADADADVADAEQRLLGDLEKLSAERDDYLGQLRRVTADFDNYRKRILKQQTEHLERAAEDLVEKLLAVLDTFDLALAHGEGFEQVHTTLVSVLEKEGLERIDPLEQPFDPTEADAVAHEDAEEGPVVADVLRPGYRWKGRVLRPAMVKVRG